MEVRTPLTTEMNRTIKKQQFYKDNPVIVVFKCCRNTSQVLNPTSVKRRQIYLLEINPPPFSQDHNRLTGRPNKFRYYLKSN